MFVQTRLLNAYTVCSTHSHFLHVLLVLCRCVVCDASEFSATEQVSCKQVSEETNHLMNTSIQHVCVQAYVCLKLCLRTHMYRRRGDTITRELVAHVQKRVGTYLGWYTQLNASSKRVYSREQKRLHERANTFIAGDKCVHLQRQTRSSPKTNTCRMRLCYTLSLISTVLISSVPLYTVWVSKTFPFRVRAMVVQRCLPFRLHTVSIFIAFCVLLGTCTV